LEDVPFRAVRDVLDEDLTIPPSFDSDVASEKKLPKLPRMFAVEEENEESA
jgi:hypothetical protein